jgi:hypothetical protein
VAPARKISVIYVVEINGEFLVERANKKAIVSRQGWQTNKQTNYTQNSIILI